MGCPEGECWGHSIGAAEERDARWQPEAFEVVMCHDGNLKAILLPLFWWAEKMGQ
jgi:hypothetical protein